MAEDVDLRVTCDECQSFVKQLAQVWLECPGMREKALIAISALASFYAKYWGLHPGNEYRNKTLDPAAELIASFATRRAIDEYRRDIERAQNCCE